MTEIEKKALALVNEAQKIRGLTGSPWNSPAILNEALYRAIERHEAFAQEVSDAAEQAVAFLGTQSEKTHRGRLAIALARFIIAKPDPLVDLCYSMGLKVTGHELRAAIEKRGGKIVWGEG